MILSHSSQLYVGVEPFPGYRLKQLLGKGGFAEVWEAATEEGNKVALKFLSGVDGHDAPREIKAIQTIRKLEHPHLTRIEQVWTYQSYIVVCMELADASLKDLQEVYQEELGTPIVPEQVCLYLSQAADALDFLNKRQHQIDGQCVAFLHCDIKPGNLLLFGDTVKLTDFGLSIQNGSRVQMHRKASTLDYATPEVFLGQMSDTMDQYSLTITYCDPLRQILLANQGARLPRRCELTFGLWHAE